MVWLSHFHLISRLSDRRESMQKEERDDSSNSLGSLFFHSIISLCLRARTHLSVCSFQLKGEINGEWESHSFLPISFTAEKREKTNGRLSFMRCTDHGKWVLTRVRLLEKFYGFPLRLSLRESARNEESIRNTIVLLENQFPIREL